jgi:hypothetical protein
MDSKREFGDAIQALLLLVLLGKMLYLQHFSSYCGDIVSVA